ncbi:general stress protein [Pedococcus sp. KACC 23699]|uniref:General stress protein n=1 Tax=Pedococcus sp. KACC 23699 TaxID=3149228 RepID=A0AAU7JQB1_9MICO
MSTQPNALSRSRAVLALEYPMSLGRYDTYDKAQRAVDYLADHEFPVQNVLIVGTDLKQLERVTGRLTRGRAALGGLISGAWLGLFVGFIFALLDTQSGAGFSGVLATVALGAVFGVVWGLIGFQLTHGPRDFTSVTQVVATQYEVLVEHKFAAQAREMLTQMDPMAAAEAQARANVEAARHQQGHDDQHPPLV